MTTLAYNEDIFNEKVLLSLTSKIKTLENLKLLYLLTFADIKSVNQGAFSSYSQKLLQDIYLNSLETFGKNEILKESEKREKIEKQIKNSSLFKELRRTEQKALLNIQSNIAFFKLTTQEIVELTKIAKNLKEDFQFFILNNNFLSIKIIRRGGVDFNIAYFLNRVSFLSVVSLDIFELFNGMKYFQIDFSEVVLDGDLYFIEEIIKQSFAIQQKTFQEISPEIKEDEIFLDCEYSKSYVKFSIHTKNQNGLLAYLFKLFEDYQIDVLSSKTRTFKRKVRDTFLLKREKDCEKYLNLIREMMLKIKNTRI
jgi:[protein-PII] uridylyltransferase